MTGFGELRLAGALLLLIAGQAVACGAPAPAKVTPPASPRREPVIGGPCEGCEIVFLGMPASIGPVSRIAPKGEAGESLVIQGTVRDGSGVPRAGIIVYAYHTDARGVYPDSQITGNRHGHFRGWAMTGADGRYRFDTIRPGGYPDTDIPQHVHLHVIEPGRGTYYIDDILFRDDPRLTPAQERALSRGRGGPGLVTPVPGDGGTVVVNRDIVLGAAVPAYPREPVRR